MAQSHEPYHYPMTNRVLGFTEVSVGATGLVADAIFSGLKLFTPSQLPFPWTPDNQPNVGNVSLVAAQTIIAFIALGRLAVDGMHRVERSANIRRPNAKG